MSAAQSHKVTRFRTSSTSPDKPLDLDALYATQFTTAASEPQQIALSCNTDNDRARSAAANQMSSAMFASSKDRPSPINPSYTHFSVQSQSENAEPQVLHPEVSRPSVERYWRADSAHICIDNFIVEDFQSSPPSPHVALQKSDVIAGRIGAANRPQSARQVVNPGNQATIDEAAASETMSSYSNEKSFPFIAAMEVEQFAWLPVVENLCLQQPTSFDRILSELKHEQRLGHRVVAVTSVKPGEGRTTIVQCLARRAAMQGLRVCIVDVDHQYPQLAEQLGLQIDVGWEATLTTPVSINDLAIESLRDQICLVPMKQALPDEVIVEHGTTCGKWLADLKRDFDLVLIDAAPTYEIIDRSLNEDAATAIHPLASWAIDSWLLVRNVQETSLAELARWNRRAQSLKLNILGVLENRTATEVLAKV